MKFGGRDFLNAFGAEAPILEMLDRFGFAWLPEWVSPTESSGRDRSGRGRATPPGWKRGSGAALDQGRIG